jgi:RNA polymerase sigma-70 factor, ECF subfamily
LKTSDPEPNRASRRVDIENNRQPGIARCHFIPRNFFPISPVILNDDVTPEIWLKAGKQGTDERLLLEAAQRDPRRFAELYEIHFHRVYAYVVGKVRRREEAEDVTSEVFHQALANIGSYEWRGVPFLAWLIRIAANVITDRWRQLSRESDDPVPEDLEDDTAEDIEQCAALSQLVQGLPEDQRRVVVLRFVEQKSIKEIAKEIRRTEGAVKQLQFRALTKLRAQMEGANA